MTWAANSEHQAETVTEDSRLHELYSQIIQRRYRVSGRVHDP